MGMTAIMPSNSEPRLKTHGPTVSMTSFCVSADGAVLDWRGLTVASYDVDAQRLVSIVGPGGIGKSLLALHLLATRLEAYPQGVCWVELAAVSDAAGLRRLRSGATSFSIMRTKRLRNRVRPV